MNVSPRSKRRIVALSAAVALFGAACGSDAIDAVEDATEEVTDEAAEAVEETTDEASEAVEDVTEEATGEEAEEEAAADGAPVELNEWTIVVDAPAAGSTTYALSNNGEFPHALAIAKGTSYEELPQLDNGAVDTETLGDDFIGSSENVEPGATGTVDFDLEAGDYVFFCPIAVGPNSHAAQGQVLSVTVAG